MSIKALIDRGWQLRSEIALLQDELKKIEDQLEKHGLNAPQQELKDDDREGRMYPAKGSNLVVPILFTADKIIASFTKGAAVQKKIEELAGAQLTEFYELSQKFESKHKDGKAFRSHAREILGAAAPAFISACLARDKHGIPKSDIKIHWDRASALPSASAPPS